MDPYEYLVKHFEIKVNKNNLYILCNSNIDFVYRDLISQNITTEYTPYGQLYQTLINKTCLSKGEYIVVLHTLEDILQTDYIFQYKKEYEEQFENYFNMLENVIKSYNVVFITSLFQRIKSPFDETSLSLTPMIEKFNLRLKNICTEWINIDSFNCNKFSISSYIDGKYCFSFDSSTYISSHIIGSIFYTRGESIKCIIVDLDNTLWKGVISEDKNIVIDEEYQLFQKVLKSYKDKGIVLCVCSKNDNHLALETLRDPRNILHPEDFVYIEANWTNKSENIQNICSKLNINEKHILFIDDSPSERHEVLLSLPNIKILNITNPEPLEYINLLYKNPYLFNKSVSQTNQTELYKIKEHIDNARKKVSSIEDFYYSLQTTIFFKLIDANSFERSFQLLLKTNQFNLNKQNFTENTFRQYIQDNIVFTISYKDKFVTFDQIGLILLTKTGSIDNIILSCRVFNRDFETCIFTFLKNWAFASKLHLRGTIVITPKNIKFQNIYQSYGFDTNYTFHPNTYLEYPKWFNVQQECGRQESGTQESGTQESHIQQSDKQDSDKQHFSEIIFDILKSIEPTISNNIESFDEIPNFSSYSMSLLLGKINSLYPNKKLKFKIFYDDNYNIINIPTFINKIHLK
jgi:FkbH-like protein